MISHDRWRCRGRTFLRGMGATLALPLLDAMVPALSATQNTRPVRSRRLGFVYLPNGVAMNFKGINHWKPAGVGTISRCRTSWRPSRRFGTRWSWSAAHHHQADVLHDGANGDHTRGTSTWLTGVHPKWTEPKPDLLLLPPHLSPSGESIHSSLTEAFQALRWRAVHIVMHMPVQVQPLLHNLRIVLLESFRSGSPMYRRINHHGDPYVVTTPNFRILSSLSVWKTPSAPIYQTRSRGPHTVKITLEHGWQAVPPSRIHGHNRFGLGQL